MYVERIKEDMLSFSSLSDLYGGHILFVDNYWRNKERMASHNLWI